MADLAAASGLASSEPAGIQASRPTSSDRGKLHVFISYSRDDLNFADQLDAALSSYGFECLIDRHGISGGEDWKRRLGNLISEADTVVFVLSPSSARSPICDWDVEEAAGLNKRILPVICRPQEGATPPPRLRELNYVFFYEEPKIPGSGFGTGLANLVTALNTDFEWLRERTRYLQRAIEWDLAADRRTDCCQATISLWRRLGRLLGRRVHPSPQPCTLSSFARAKRRRRRD
jgi:TIR domain